jgi:hypothetical protein
VDEHLEMERIKQFLLGTWIEFNLIGLDEDFSVFLLPA